MPRPSITVKNFTPTGGEDGPGLDNDPMTYLQRLFVYFLQNLFRDYPEGCGMRWKPEQEDTEIMITTEKPQPDAVGKTPHIICVLGSGRWTGLGLDQLQSQRASDGQRTHTDLIPMTMNYHCQASSGVHARRIAWNASLYTIALRRILMRVGGLHDVGRNHTISAEGPLTQFTGPQPENELIEVLVNVPFYWQPQWRIKKPSEVWKNLRMTLNVNEAAPRYSAGRQNKLRPPSVRGVPVSTTPLDPPQTAFTQSVDESKPFGEE